MDVGPPKTLDQPSPAADECEPCQSDGACVDKLAGKPCDCTCGDHGTAPPSTTDEGDDSNEVDEQAWHSERAPVVDEPTPESIEELSSACVRFVKDALGVELDFTAETLPLLDHYLQAAREQVDEKLELRELLWRTAGAYFGEVLRRRLNGYWQLPTEDVHTWRVCGRHVLLSTNPVGIVAEAMAGSSDSDGPSGVLRLARADQADVSQRLAEMPMLPEDEFFLTSTRLEIIDVVVEHLRLCMDQSDHSDIEFDLEDYARDLMPYGQA